MSRSGPRKSSVSSKQELQPGKTSEGERRGELGRESGQHLRGVHAAGRSGGWRSLSARSAEVCAAFETTGREENRRRRTAPLFSKHILSFWFHIGSAVGIVQSAGGDVPASESD